MSWSSVLSIFGNPESELCALVVDEFVLYVTGEQFPPIIDGGREFPFPPMRMEGGRVDFPVCCGEL
jgi:hypothetical protein